MSDDFNKAIIGLYHELERSYPNYYRFGGEKAAVDAVKYWKNKLHDQLSSDIVTRLSETYIGCGIFETHPPKPKQAIELMKNEGNPYYQMSLRLDEVMAAYYLSLYPKEPGVRLKRVEEVAMILSDARVTQVEMTKLVGKIKTSAEWRSYPPSMYDIEKIVLRGRAGIESCDQEFLNYCQSIRTPGVDYVCATIGRDNLRTLNLDRLSAMFKKVYYALDDKGWPEIEEYTETSDDELSASEESGSKEITRSVSIT